MSFQSIVEEIMATHHSLLKRELPRISEQMAALSAQYPESEPITEAAQIFAKVRGKVEAHLKDEESVLFPSGIALERGGETVPSEMDFIDRLAEMEKEHEGCSKTLAGIQKTIEMTTPPSPARDGLLANIQLIQDDFVTHVEKENTKVHPMLLEMLNRKG